MKITDAAARLYPIIRQEWKLAHNEHLKVNKFEDLFGPDQYRYSRNIFSHCILPIPASAIQYLVDQYSFSKLNKRKRDIEDKKHHYRKAVSGNWKNYFTMNIKGFSNNRPEIFVSALLTNPI